MAFLLPEHIRILAAKKLKGTISPEEDAQLEEWYSQEPGNQMIWDSKGDSRIEIKDRLFTGIQRRAGIHKRRRHWAVAAAVLVLMGTGAGLFIAREKSTPHSIAADIPPGRNGAILTLGNGARILLDSVSSGNVAVQGSTSILKSDGQVAYVPGLTGSKTPIVYNMISTPRARQYHIVLPDGTRVWLNAASTLQYPTSFSGTERKVTLTGEAYFEVSQNPRQPFNVVAGPAKITVLGTSMDVMNYPENREVTTTLLEGSVSVSNGQTKKALRPGEQAGVGPAQVSVKEVDTADAIAWMKGKLSTGEVDVKTLMYEIGRWYDVDVSFEGKAPDKRFWGLIGRNVYLSDVLQVLNASGISVRLEGNTLIVR